MTSPYKDLPSGAYWKSGVAERSPLDPGDLYNPRFKIDKRTKIVTAGSCFAQHVGRTLKNAGFNVQDAEALPPTVPDEVANRFGYRLYSARYGNIYTIRQMLQLLKEAFGEVKPSHPVWERNGRFYDAFRPSVEPDGLPSYEDVIEHRAEHLAAVSSLMSRLDVLVFTFGLTEAWVSRADGTVYPTAPETIAGEFDPEIYAFHNFEFREIFSDFLAVRAIVKGHNPRAKFIVTVSPVPLTATASGHHVEVASTYSKAVLRAACGQLYKYCPDVDYFPSYEVITSQAARGAYYQPNLRSDSKQGVETAMGLFMSAHAGAQGPQISRQGNIGEQRAHPNRPVDDVVCEEALLEAFGKK